MKILGIGVDIVKNKEFSFLLEIEILSKEHLELKSLNFQKEKLIKQIILLKDLLQKKLFQKH